MNTEVAITGAATGAVDTAGDHSALPVTPVQSAQRPRDTAGRAIADLARERDVGVVATIEAMQGEKR